MSSLHPGPGRVLLAWMMLATVLAPAFAWTQTAAPTVPDAVRLELADALPRTAFYDTPADLAASRPGDLLRKAEFNAYDLPPGARAVRILYHSKDANGVDVATSGVVLIPPGPAPADGWPVIAWAHGTSGVARRCAPSLMRDVYYGEEGLFPMVRAGYAVVATDYHGLGTEGPHQYVNKIAQARDVIYSIPAARAAVPELGAKWVADGHSQGGTAAWAVAELERGRADPGYLGAVAVAPASQLRKVLAAAGTTSTPGFYIDYIAWAVNALTPSFDPSEMLSGAALERYDAVTTKGCFAYGFASSAGDTGPSPLKPGWAKSPAGLRFLKDTDIGAAPIARPLLVVAGEADQTVPIAAVRATVAQACAKGLSLEFRTFPGLDHDPTMDKSTPDQLAWIGDRFAGRPAGNVCPTKAVPPPATGKPN